MKSAIFAMAVIALSLLGGQSWAGEVIVSRPGAAVFPRPLPNELMPRRYADYPVTNAYWAIVSTGETCAVALDLPEITSRSRLLGQAVLQVAGHSAVEAEAMVASAAEAVRSAGPVAGAAERCQEAMRVAEEAVRQVLTGK